MTNLELVAKALDIATNYKTLYVNGTWGWPMMAKNKIRALRNPYNETPTRAAKIRAASPDTFGFDCCGLIKGIIWGWSGDQSQVYGGAGYKVNGLPDLNEAGMIAISSPTSDFASIVPGGLVWRSGHIGIYAGEGLVIEATPSWEDGVQITACGNIGPKPGYKTRTWTRWGKFPYIIYKEEDMNYEIFKAFMDQYLRDLQKLPADDYAKPALEWAKEEGIMQGSGSGNLMPQSPVKREELVVMLERFMNVLNQQ